MENIKEQLEEVIKKNLPEKRELKECGKCNACEMMMACEVLYADRQFNQALSQINTSLIADEVLKVVVEKIKEEKTRLKNVEWNPQWNLEIEDKIEEVNKILQLLSNLSPNKENK
jgi:Na+-translocating ferredoxin:NAD+ oxidoreductase RnfC subunit